MPALHRTPHDDEDGETVLYQRQAPASRCPICPYRHVLENMSKDTSAIPALGILPLPSHHRNPPATLPRPALLAEPRGSGTLLLPDALKPGGPEAATVAGPLATAAAPTHHTTPAPFDELASPDITVLQIPAVTPTPTRPRPRRAPPDPHAFFVLNLCLGLAIVIGLLALAARALQPPAATAAPEPHASQ
ncbi:MAG: hypothetical protein IPO88_07860 [Nannocystis sp.]|uniref:hypothetical protein n=1 Tax=Nannocystis sp. TaxID=1962667 RepID=UPI00242633F6|nr:hypothetical protein [Nannocystis sp.]MBK9753411.1 hypothetical protein [Nannocystis sp.]